MVGKRCQHPDAKLVERRGDWVDCFCGACRVGWCGSLIPWRSSHACARLHKPPRWVIRVANQAEVSNVGR